MDFSNLFTTPYALVALIVATVSFIFLAVYYGLMYLKTACHKSTTHNEDAKQPAVSIVLTAHNDAKWLRENLVYLLEQDYPNYEVVVVDYLSTDDTQFILQVCGDTYPNLKVVRIKQDVNMVRSKKFPISIGIKSARKNNDIMVFIDADCVPKNFNWIRTLVRGYENPKSQIVLGYCGLKWEKGLLNALQQYENLTNNLSMIGCALLAHPYTGCGRNLSYRKGFFYHNGAFIRHYYEPEGADDMFVNQNANASNTTVVIDPDAFVVADPKKNFHQWHLHRRHRQASRRHYSWNLKLQHALHPLSVLLFYAAIAVMALSGVVPWEVIVGLFVIKTGWQIFTLYKASKRFEVKGICWLAPFFEIYFLFANTILQLIPFNYRKR